MRVLLAWPLGPLALTWRQPTPERVIGSSDLLPARQAGGWCGLPAVTACAFGGAGQIGEFVSPLGRPMFFACIVTFLCLVTGMVPRVCGANAFVG
jgi:hypothetical protein